MTVYEMKKDFVENELTALLKKVDENIDHTRYYVSETNEEYVIVSFKTGYGGNIKICVTADSLSALTRDVLKNIN